MLFVSNLAIKVIFCPATVFVLIYFTYALPVSIQGITQPENCPGLMPWRILDSVSRSFRSINESSIAKRTISGLPIRTDSCAPPSEHSCPVL